MEEGAYVVHHIPGRMRIKIPGARGKLELLRDVAEVLRALSYVTAVDANPLTGTLLVRYLPQAFDALANFLSDQGVDASNHSGPNRLPNSRAMLNQWLRQADEALREATEKQLDLRLLVPLTAVGAGLLAARRGGPTPLWLTLLIFAFSSYMALDSSDQSAKAQEVATGAEAMH
jgi:hypothetical protein